MQFEFNALKQKPTENAQTTFFQHINTVAMELYESLIEKRDIVERKRITLKTTQDHALLNFELGLREDIKMIVRSQKYNNL